MFRGGIENDVQPSEGQTVEERWSALKDNILRNAIVHVGYKTRNGAKKPWVTEAMLQKMRERRKEKSKHTAEGQAKYRQLNNELRRETERARSEWWERECEEMEELDKRGRSDLVYAKVKQLISGGKSSGWRFGARSDWQRSETRLPIIAIIAFDICGGNDVRSNGGN